ncbi:hypothetical protein HY379_00265 [Candidatus Saccharibacteria bacterium]|nr:hypothetical protein [Candidatus Saccharibacteria bacterium]
MERPEQTTAERVTLSPALLSELTLASLGNSAQQSANAQEITEGGVKKRRKLINRLYGTRNIRQAIFEGMQNGDLPINLEGDPVLPHLSPTQQVMLALAANGYYAEEIAKRCTVSRHTVNSNFEAIRHRLNARSMNHAMRRAFELGLFKVGEAIPDPIEEQQQKFKDLQVAVGGVALKASEIGINNLNELELLSLLGDVQDGYFTSKNMADMGFLESADSKASRYHAYGRAASSVSQKLAQAFGQQIIERVGNNGNSRRYIVKTSLEVGQPDEMSQIASFSGKTSNRRGRMISTGQKRTRRKFNKTPTHAIGISARDDEYLDHSSLPELNSDFLSSLGKRDPQEVLENTEVKIAIESIVKQGLLIDYRPRVIVSFRYGVSPDLKRTPLMLKRNGTYVPLREVMQYIPPYQGLDVDSASQILGLRPLAILQAEKALIASYKKSFPALKSLEPGIENQISALSAS